MHSSLQYTEGENSRITTSKSSNFVSLAIYVATLGQYLLVRCMVVGGRVLVMLRYLRTRGDHDSH